MMVGLPICRIHSFVIETCYVPLKQAAENCLFFYGIGAVAFGRNKENNNKNEDYVYMNDLSNARGIYKVGGKDRYT